MPPEKSSHFLDAGESDDDASQGYDSETEQLRKGGRSAKRRRLSEDISSNDEEGPVLSDGEDEHVVSEAQLVTSASAGVHGTSTNERPQTGKDGFEIPDVSGPLVKKNLVATEAATKKSGLIYISRVPPFMKPMKLRSLLEPYGKINRVFLTPEDPQAHSRRVRSGGNKKRSYTDGWVEFVKKKDAKKVVDLLNARTIGGKGFYRDDIWSLKYLRGFKWNDLTAQIASEAAERTSRMRAEISKSTKENKEFVRNVEKAKVIEGIQAKAAAKRKNRSEGEEGFDHLEHPDTGEPRAIRKFKQAAVAKKEGDKAPEEAARRVLSQLF